MTFLKFPNNFLWGTATSAYQIEGAFQADGRGLSHWDTFSKTPGKTLNGDTGDIACDHYNRWPEDIALMKSLNLQAYRFSISWPRIVPDGVEAVNQKGLDYYKRLVDGLLEADITPYLTLYHWELPQPLQDIGGWPERAVADRFAHLADVISNALGDRVKHWITHNEPWCTSMLSHQEGVHAPGWTDWNAALRSAHTVLISHGMAAQAVRANVSDALVGSAPNFEPAYPETDSHADYEAARIWNGYYIRWFLDPLFGFDYPADMVEHYSQKGHLPNGLDFVHEGDYKLIAQPQDFVGVNNYTRQVVRANPDATLPTLVKQPDADHTEMDWEIYPDGLYDLLNNLHFRYRPKSIIITENGCSFSDGLDEKGRIADERRTNYLRKYLAGVHRAIGNGVPVDGYFVWSFMDNFEWTKGYSQRFGMVYVDYETQERLPKDSMLWYKRTIQNNGFLLE